MNLFVLFLVGLLASCGFSSDKEKNNAPKTVTKVLADSKYLDSDGDFISNYEEVNRNTNPFVSDIPELDLSFKSGITFKIGYKHKTFDHIEYISVSTDDYPLPDELFSSPSELLITKRSKKESAKNGQFNSHVSGKLSKTNPDWVVFPEVHELHRQKVLMGLLDKEQLQHFDRQSLSLSFNVSLRLGEHEYFKSVKNSVLNFYFYDHFHKSYQLIKSKRIEGSHLEKQRVDLEVKIDSAPVKLLFENFFKYGQFLVAEISDFEIPHLSKNYSTLMSSVKSKTVPVAISTPLRNELHYVASDIKPSLAELLDYRYKEHFEIQGKDLKSIGGFASNLKSYKNLLDFKDEDKTGKWFVLTNEIPNHYGVHRFRQGDFISLVYMRGSELARKPQKVDTSDPFVAKDELIKKLGVFSKNSKLTLSFNRPIVFDRPWSKAQSDTYHSSGASCGDNCITPEYTCTLNSVVVKDSYRPGVFDTESEFLNYLYLSNSKEKRSIKSLITQDQGIIQQRGDLIQIKIRDISGLFDDKELNQLELILEQKVKSVLPGARLVSKSGADSYQCPGVLLKHALANKLPISIHSVEFDDWSKFIDTGQVSFADRDETKRSFQFSAVATLTNYFN